MSHTTENKEGHMATTQTYKRVTETTRIDTGEFAVIAVDKQTGDARTMDLGLTGWSECDDYVQRNTSEDNLDRYYVAKAVAA